MLGLSVNNGWKLDGSLLRLSEFLYFIGVLLVGLRKSTKSLLWLAHFGFELWAFATWSGGPVFKRAGRFYCLMFLLTCICYTNCTWCNNRTFISFHSTIYVFRQSLVIFRKVFLKTDVFLILISNFHRVLNAVLCLLGNLPASELLVPTFRNFLSVPSS